MSRLSDVNPYSLYLDEKMDDQIWNEAQEYFDFIYGGEINDDIIYHICETSRLKEQKQKMIRIIYDKKMKDKNEEAD